MGFLVFTAALLPCGDRRQGLVGERQIDRLVALGRKIGREYVSITLRAFSGATIDARSSMTGFEEVDRSGPICPANTWSICSPGMVDIGNCVPSETVLSQLSRWVSSRNREPSVPVISNQVAQ